MKFIESVRVFHSLKNYQDGVDLGPGFSILIKPHPKTQDEIEHIGDALRACMLELEMEVD